MPGQLQSEIDRPVGNGTWLTCKVDEAIIFNLNGDQLWHAALEMYSQQAVDHFF